MSKPKKLRLDELLVTRGLCANVEEARRRIWAGEVIVGEEMVDQAGTRVSDEASLRLRSRRGRYAGRGGEKLEHALRSFCVTTEGRTALDVGAAVGGFTDCLLAHGASRVYAVELGRGQLAQRLRLDSRVVDMSGRDILTVQPAELAPRPTLAVVDVTFCSLAALLPKVQELLSDEQETLALLKPLFEARLAGLGRVEDVQRRVFEWLLPRLQELGLPVLDVIASPLPGVGGAIEFFLHIRRPGRADAELPLGEEALPSRASGIPRLCLPVGKGNAFPEGLGVPTASQRDWEEQRLPRGTGAAPAEGAQGLLERVEAALSEARAKLSKRSRPGRSGQKRRKKWKQFSSPGG